MGGVYTTLLRWGDLWVRTRGRTFRDERLDEAQIVVVTGNSGGEVIAKTAREHADSLALPH